MSNYIQLVVVGSFNNLNGYPENKTKKMIYYLIMHIQKSKLIVPNYAQK
jgi:hypothetical protein